MVSAHRIKFKKIVPEAVEPTKAHHNDAGYDMVAVSKIVNDQYIQYGTGIAMEIPDGMVGLIFPRSSVTKKNLMLKNAVGVIDAGYRGEISFRFWMSPETFIRDDKSDAWDETLDIMMAKEPEIYEVGDKIGQIIFQKLPDTVLLEVDELDDSERGEGGYGSTDNKK